MDFHLTLDNFINDVLKIVDEITAQFIETGYRAIAEHWISSGLMTSVLTLYVIYFFYQVKCHDIPISDATTHVIKVSVVFTLATNWSVFYIVIYNVVTNEPMAISNLLMSKLMGAKGSLNEIFSEGMKKGFELLSNMPFSIKGVVTCLLGAILLMVATCLFTLIAVGLIIISKFYLAVLLVLAPYFIVMHLFNGAKGLTESWMKEVIGKALVPVFVGCILLLTSTLAKLCLNVGHAGFASAKTPDFVGIILYLVCSILSLYLFKVVPETAASLTSSLAIAGAGRIANHAGNAMNAARAASSRVSQQANRAKDNFGQRQQRLLEQVKQRADTRQQQDEAARALRASQPY